MNDEASEPYEPTEDEVEQMRSASPDEAAEVDKMILSVCSGHWKKVAMVVGKLLDAFDARFEHLPYCFIQARIQALEDNHVVEVAGDPWAMRYSEVRLVPAASEA